MEIRTEFEFELPIGFVDVQGNGHKTGTMRLATAVDELSLINDPRIVQNEAYASILILSQVVTSLGSLAAITPQVIEGLFVADLVYLQALYQQVNEKGLTTFQVACPHCNENHELDLMQLGELNATP